MFVCYVENKMTKYVLCNMQSKLAVKHTHWSVVRDGCHIVSMHIVYD